MTRQGIWQTGKFDIKTGMVFTMPDMPNIFKDKKETGTDIHPWLVLNTKNDYVEIIMCSTLISNKENKHRIFTFNDENETDITNPCPPMDKPEDRTSKVSFDTFRIIPKKELFSHKIKICNNSTKTRNLATEGLQALCLNNNDVKFIRKETMEFIYDHPLYNYDPFKCEKQSELLYDLQHNYPVPKGFTQQSYDKQFAWQHIKPAYKYAVYPFEDQMYDYEKNDPNLLKIAKAKKQYIRQQRIQQAQNVSPNTATNQANKQNTGPQV